MRSHIAFCKIEMMEKQLTIVNKLGLHARAAAKFVKAAALFQSSLIVQKGMQEVNGKSIMGVMMLAAAKGVSLTLRADGADEINMLNTLTELVENRFGEDE